MAFIKKSIIMRILIIEGKGIGYMYNLNSEIKDFLSNIEPDIIYKEQASNAQTTLRDYLQSSEVFKDMYLDSFLTGSYKRNTAIKEIKDVDIIVILNKPATFIEPNDDVKELYNLLKKSFENSDMYEIKEVEQQQRSIKLIWRFKNDEDNEIRKEELTLDVVPAIRSSDGSNYNLWIPDKNLNKWIKTNPQGHIDKITEKNQGSTDINGQKPFIPFVKILKFWKSESYKVPKKPKGFLLECIAYHSWNNHADNWFDCLKNGYEDILNKYEMYMYLGSNDDKEIDFIYDIGLEGSIIHTSTTFANFRKFINKIKETIAILSEVEEADSKYDAILKLQDIFGNEYFPNPKETDKNIKNDNKTNNKSVSVITGSNKNPEAKSYGQI